MGKGTEVPCIQAFTVLYQNPALCSACNQKPGESENTPDILDDPLLTFPNSQQGNQASPASLEAPTSPEPPTSLEAPISPDDSDRSQTLPPMCLYILRCPRRERLVPPG